MNSILKLNLVLGLTIATLITGCGQDGVANSQGALGDTQMGLERIQSIPTECTPGCVDVGMTFYFTEEGFLKPSTSWVNNDTVNLGIKACAKLGCSLIAGYPLYSPENAYFQDVRAVACCQ